MLSWRRNASFHGVFGWRCMTSMGRLLGPPKVSIGDLSLLEGAGCCMFASILGFLNRNQMLAIVTLDKRLAR